MSIDRFYLPIIDGPYHSAQNPGDWITEMPMSELDYDSIVRNIASGELEDVRCILCIDPKKGKCNSVSHEVAQAVAQYYMIRYRQDIPKKLSMWLWRFGVDSDAYKLED